MLMNFCDSCLLSEAKCNTASNEGNDVTNLTTNQNGFLAYYAVRPPVHIDFKFICKIRISHVIIWPSVNSQRSSGLRLSVKPTERSADYNDVLTVFLKPTEEGVFLYRNDISYPRTAKPKNFADRYMTITKFPTINAASNLRISIIKTDNSVPAIQRIEIWGSVSAVCEPSTKATLETLWNRRFNNSNLDSNSETKKETKRETVNDQKYENSSNLLNIPEEFTDPITCELMTSPIVLPSGNIVDQLTLEKHEKQELKWGRPLSDPFTGLPFNSDRVPVPAVSLKIQIDQFLIRNCNNPEVKRMPRILGSKQPRPAFTSELFFKRRKAEVTKISQPDSNNKNQETVEQKKTHRLPSCTLRSSNSSLLIPKAVRKRSAENSNETLNHDSVLHKCRKIQKRDTANCNCCDDKILYELPCKHIFCRKILLASKNKCLTCEKSFRTSDTVRIYV